MIEVRKEENVNTACQLESVARSDVGLRRSENQDSYCVLERPEYCFYALADGMGGAAGGSTASLLAVETARQYLETKKLISEPVLTEAVRLANRRVFEKAQAEEVLKGMGTTFVALAFAGTDMFVANVGDSRAYRYRNGTLTRLTEDHTFRKLLQQTSGVPAENLKESPMSHLLTRSVGTGEEVEIDCRRSNDRPLPGDVYLLCSDGLHGYLTNYEIAHELEASPFEEVAGELVRAANDRGGYDNVTVIAVRVQENHSFLSTTSKDVPGSAKAKKHSNRGRLPITFLAGLMLGALLFNVDRVVETIGVQQHIEGPGVLEIRSSRPNRSVFIPDVGAVKRDDSLLSIDLETITAQETDKALAELQMFLKGIRSRIDVATRKLSVWHKRREDFFNKSEILSLAVQVAVSNPSVRSRIDDLQNAEWDYLKEAEELLYHPADRNQEAKVAALRERRNTEAAALRSELQHVIDAAVERELYQIRLLSSQRDKLQAAIEQVKLRIGSSTSVAIQPG